jgi:hypothetical protein
MQTDSPLIRIFASARSRVLLLMKNKKLLRYLGAAASTASVAHAQTSADVLYTDFEPDILLEGNLQSIRVDVNLDSIDDFVFIAEDTLLQAVNGSYNIGRLRAGGYANSQNLVMGSIPSLYGYVAQADFGDAIGPDNEFIIAGTMAMNIDGQNPFNEPWNGGAYDKYIGFKMRFGTDSSHYGWMRLDVSADGKRALIKDAVFSLLPDTAIASGFARLNTHQWAEELLIKQDAGHIELTLGPALSGTTFDLSDLSGKKLWSAQLEEGLHRLLMPQKKGLLLLTARRKGNIRTWKIMR